MSSGARNWLVVLTVALVLALASSGCGDSNEKPFPDVISLGEGEISPVILNSSLTLGQNRFSLGLLDEEEAPILDASLRLRFFDLNGTQPLLKNDIDARFVSMELFFIDEAANGRKVVVGRSGAYAADIEFPSVGRWGVEISGRVKDKDIRPIRFQFNVVEQSDEVMVGDPVPQSKQLTTADVADIREMDTSFPPRPHMHDITVAEALSLGRPAVIAFATPAYCESRHCGPIMEAVMDPLYAKYASQASFIHIEPYQLPELRAGQGEMPVQAALEWGIQTEPWVFVVDKQGQLTAKFEGIASTDEVEAELQKALNSP